MKLLPSRRVLRTPYNHAPCHFMQSHIRKVHAYLAVTCHPHFWQNDLGLLCATVVTRGWNGYRNWRVPCAETDQRVNSPLCFFQCFSTATGTVTRRTSPSLTTSTRCGQRVPRKCTRLSSVSWPSGHRWTRAFVWPLRISGLTTAGFHCVYIRSPQLLANNG